MSTEKELVERVTKTLNAMITVGHRVNSTFGTLYYESCIAQLEAFDGIVRGLELAYIEGTDAGFRQAREKASTLVEQRFASGALPAATDANTFPRFFQDAEGTIPVTTAGQFIGRVEHPDGSVVVQGNMANRPVAQADGQGRLRAVFVSGGIVTPYSESNPAPAMGGEAVLPNTERRWVVLTDGGLNDAFRENLAETMKKYTRPQEMKPVSAVCSNGLHVDMTEERLLTCNGVEWHPAMNAWLKVSDSVMVAPDDHDRFVVGRVAMVLVPKGFNCMDDNLTASYLIDLPERQVLVSQARLALVAPKKAG